MTRPRRNAPRPDPIARKAAEETLRGDLQALHTASAENLPTLDSTTRLLHASRAGHNPGGVPMSMFRRFQARPWPATAIFAAVVAVALLFVPISYQKTVGQDVALTLAVPELDPSQVQTIASEFQTALHATELSIDQHADGGLVLTARVPNRSGTTVALAAQAFAAGLTGRGFPSTAQVTPRVELALGSAYAYAWDNVVNIQVTSDGKTPAQIEAEIRDQLEAAGIEAPMVKYAKEGDRTSVAMMMSKTPAECEGAAECCPQVNISIDGREPGDDGSGQRKCEILIRRTAETTDADVIADIEQQLREQGIDAAVTMEDGMPVICPRNP
jgi:hypothetical protein